ncbi:MAG: EAL domain-containing protein, partial [Gammaproteobacteria bacterium]|nr:EAL domain-containing protein [Gammaproteobacteria bacterium]
MSLAPLFLDAGYRPGIVMASLLIATLASYVTLDLSLRVRSASGPLQTIWWAAGSLVMGTGIWSMHFVGMLAFVLPIQLGFTGLMTLLSWVAAVAASGIALHAASRADYSARAVCSGAIAMGIGICAMHYIGMAAIDLSPGIVWNGWTVAASAAIAVGASAAALVIFRLLIQVRADRRIYLQLLASVVMGAAIGGMHYTGMAAAQFPQGAVCLSAGGLGGSGLTAIVVAATCMLLVGALFASILEARLQVVARQLSQSLQESNAQLKTANEELQHRAFTDVLTGLPNRLFFETRLANSLQRLEHVNQAAVQQQIAVLFVDLDGFKPINDSLGHAAGDQVLQTAAKRLLEQSGAGNTVARIGGDEFLVLLEGLADTDDCVAVVDRILAALASPFEAMGTALQIACSIGVVMHPAHGRRRDMLIADADAAMYAAKRAGGARHVLFEPRMTADTTDALQLQTDLRKALERGQFELYYQPKIDGRKSRLSGMEALIRWNHPILGTVSRAKFIALAERSGLIVPLGEWVIREACRQMAAWSREGSHLRVAVNLSAMQLAHAGLVKSIEAALRTHGLPGDRLICEITESVALEDLEVTQRTFHELQRLDVHLSIDDFGTGYSSLSQLRELPVRQLKVDRSFIMDLESRPDARAVVDAVIKLAHALSLTVVAEGVETTGQRDILLRMGCDELQGFFYARPMPAGDVLGWVAD